MVSIAMQVVNPSQVTGKKVLLRLDLDVPIENGEVKENFRLRADLPTLKMCLENASQVIVLGHVGRPKGKVVPELSVEPVRKWFESLGFKLNILENLRFDPREDACDIEYAKELAQMGDIFVNEAFASHHPATSTTVLPTLLPRLAGLRFAQEVEKLTTVKNKPKKPFVAIIGGAKIEDKLPVIEVLAKTANAVLVGGKLVTEIREQNLSLPKNVMVGKLNENRFDIAAETVLSWKSLFMNAKMIVWSGPLGKFEDPKNSATYEIARMVLDSTAEVIIGGGDTIAALGQYGLLKEAEDKAFVSTGGGAMLKFLVTGTLSTIKALL